MGTKNENRKVVDNSDGANIEKLNVLMIKPLNF